MSEAGGAFLASDRLFDIAERDTDRLLIVDPRFGRFTYGDVAGQVCRLAAALHQRGLGPGDIVILQLPNWAPFLIFHLALTAIGAVTITLPITYREKELNAARRQLTTATCGVVSLNIVFDLGGVVFYWRPDVIIQSVFDDAETQALVKAKIFGHTDWIRLDRGTLSADEAMDRGAVRTGLPRADIDRLFDAVPRSLAPVPGTIDLIRSVRGHGNKLFVLSNMGHASIEYLEHKHDIWDLFDGIVISCRIQKVKPEVQIYERSIFASAEA